MTLAHHPAIGDLAIFLVPVVVAIVALRWAEKKARTRAEKEDALARDPSPDEQP